MSVQYAIGVDLGGTELRGALVARDGEVLKHERALTDLSGGPEGVMRQMRHFVKLLREGLEDSQLLGVGVGSPGPLNADEGVVISPPNLPGWTNVPLRAILRERLGLNVEVGNDANVAAYGEWRFGAGRGVRHLVYVTISTGIGGGVIADGKLLLGRGGFAAEVGHMSIAVSGRECNCGHHGCWEALASGMAMARWAVEAIAQGRTSLISGLAGPAPVTAHHVTLAAEQGDPLALEILEDEARYLAIGLVNLLHLYSPDRIVIGGGVSQSFHLMEKTILEIVQARAMPAYRAVPIVHAKLGQRAGVVGAAALVIPMT